MDTCLWNRAESMEKSKRIFYVCSENEFFNNDTTIKIGQTIFDDEFSRMHFVERFKAKTTKIFFNNDYFFNLKKKAKSKQHFILPRDIEKFLEMFMRNDKKEFLKNLDILIMSKIYRYKLRKIIDEKLTKYQKEQKIPNFPYELIENILIS